MADELEGEELIAHWEAVLSAEGLGERIYKKQIRGPRGTPERRSAVQREVVVAPDQLWIWEQAVPDPTRAPENAMQAFMEALPHTDPAQDKESSQELREALLDAMEDLLEPDMVDLICRRYFGQASIAELAEEEDVPLSTMSERIHRAILQLQDGLPGTSGTIDNYLGEQP